MPNTTVNLVKGPIPPNACFSSVQALYDLFIDQTTAHVKGQYTLFNYGESAPAASDRDKPWIRTINQSPDKIYVHQSGYWLSKHPSPASSKERRIWTGTAAELITYDGGSDATTPNVYQGPMWEIDDTLTPTDIATKSYEADIYDTATVETLLNASSNPDASVTQAHELGELPDNVTATYLCITDDNGGSGYEAGDEVPVYSTYCNMAGTHVDTPTISVSFNETEVYARMYDGVRSREDRLYVLPKGGGDRMTLPASKFKVRLRVWKKGGKTISTTTASLFYIKRTSRVFYTA